MIGWKGGKGKTGLGLVLVLLLAIAYISTALQQDQGSSDDSELILEAVSSSPTIIDLHPRSVPPGGTLALRFESETQGEVRALLGSEELTPIEVYTNEAVFRVPEGIRGKAELSLRVGEAQSAPQLLDIEPLNKAKIARNVAGGLALVMLGLLSLSRAFRRRAGANLRRRVGTLTRSVRKSLTFGVALGGLSQTSTLAAALALPSAERHVLSFRSALIVILAAHVGAVVVGALLPLAATREALLIITAGVILRLTTSDSQGRAIAKMIIGLGLLLHGAHTLRTGLAPLAEQPSWLLELRHLEVMSPGGLLLTALLGGLLAFAAQSPGVAFVLVLSVCQATSFLSVEQGLAILAGTTLGAALSTTMISWPLGLLSRRIALAHGLLALLSLVLMWLMLPWLPDLLTIVLGTNPEELARGKKILRPNISLHLVVGFIAMQAAATALAMLATKTLSRKLNPTEARAAPREIDESTPPVKTALEQQHLALEAMEGILLGDPSAPSHVDAHLERVRRLSEEQLETGVTNPDTLIAILAVQQSLEQVRYTVTRAAERGLKIEGESGRCIENIHAHLLAGLDDAIALIDGSGSTDLEELRAREIRINATEADLRARLRRESADKPFSSEMLDLAELANGYESVGNQIYRLSLGLLPDDF